MTQEPFDNWLDKVDMVIEQKFGIGTSDLPDVDYWSWCEDGMTPKRAAMKALRNAGWKP